MPRNWFELVVIILALGSGAIGALTKRLREQAAKKRAQDARMRAELERLRTGRDPEQPPPPAAPEPVAAEPEVVRKRREHIERLRRASAPADAVVIQVPGAGPVVIARRPVPGPRTAPPPARPAPRREPKRRPRPEESTPPARTPHVLTPTESTTHRRLSAEPEAAEVAPSLAAPLPRSREEWRRLVVLQEVFSPPLALRKDRGPTLYSGLDG